MRVATERDSRWLQRAREEKVRSEKCQPTLVAAHVSQHRRSVSLLDNNINSVFQSRTWPLDCSLFAIHSVGTSYLSSARVTAVYTHLARGITLEGQILHKGPFRARYVQGGRLALMRPSDLSCLKTGQSCTTLTVEGRNKYIYKRYSYEAGSFGPPRRAPRPLVS
jgi:hypothetical protein